MWPGLEGNVIPGRGWPGARGPGPRAPLLWAPVPAGAWPLALQGELGVAIDALWCGDVAWVHWDATGAAYLR